MFIRIFASPKNCLLLDKLKVGQTVAVSNLIFTKSMFKFGEAIANHLTIVSCYPQQKHLQEGIEKLNQQFPKVSRLHSMIILLFVYILGSWVFSRRMQSEDYILY